MVTRHFEDIIVPGIGNPNVALGFAHGCKQFLAMGKRDDLVGQTMKNHRRALHATDLGQIVELIKRQELHARHDPKRTGKRTDEHQTRDS